MSQRPPSGAIKLCEAMLDEYTSTGKLKFSRGELQDLLIKHKVNMQLANAIRSATNHGMIHAEVTGSNNFGIHTYQYSSVEIINSLKEDASMAKGAPRHDDTEATEQYKIEKLTENMVALRELLSEQNKTLIEQGKILASVTATLLRIEKTVSAQNLQDKFDEFTDITSSDLKRLTEATTKLLEGIMDSNHRDLKMFKESYRDGFKDGHDNLSEKVSKILGVKVV